MRYSQSFKMFTVFFHLACIILLKASGAQQQPNILWIFTDQWQPDWDGMHYSKKKLPLSLPNIKKLAKQGTRFLNAYSAAPLCSPSRVALAVGRDYDQAGQYNNLNAEGTVANQSTYVKQLAEAGYHTMLAGKGVDTYAEKKRCNANRVQHGIVQRSDYGAFLRNQTVLLRNGSNVSGLEAYIQCTTTNQCTFPDNDLYLDNWMGNEALKYVKGTYKKPWFLQVGFMGPHPPFFVSDEMFKAVDGKTFPSIVDNLEYRNTTTCHSTGKESGFDLTLSLCHYAAMMENIDSLIGRLLEQVNESNTVVCFSSDHGNMHGIHGMNGKEFPWRQSVVVPLICRGPGIRADAVVQRPVALIDIGATFLDYGRAKLTPEMTTMSLRPLLETGQMASYREFVSSGLQLTTGADQGMKTIFAWRMVVRDNLTYICCRHSCGPLQKELSKPPNGAHHKQLHDQNGYFDFLFDGYLDPFERTLLNDVFPQNESMKELRKLLPESFPCKRDQ